MLKQLKISKTITNRDSLSFNKYLVDIGNIPMISQQEEIELAKRIRQGDEKALEKLVTANLRFVVSVAKKYEGQGLPLSDVVNEGNAGLIKAAKRFDETRGFKFISFAVWWIRQTILQAINENSRIVRIPLNKVGSIIKYNKAISKLEQKNGMTPADEEVMNEMGLTKSEFQDILSSNGRTHSIDMKVKEGEDMTLSELLTTDDIPSPDKELFNESLRHDINMALNILSPMEKYVIENLYGLNGKTALSMGEIAVLKDYSPERIRQIKEKALRRLKLRSVSKILRTHQI